MSDEDYNIAADCYELILTGEIKGEPEALDFLTHLQKKYPNHPPLNGMIALTYFIQGKSNKCKKALEKKLKKNLSTQN